MTATASRDTMRCFFEPQTVAVIGASRTPGKAGYQQILNLHDFQGTLVPINPGGGEIDGLTCVRHVNEVQNTVDLAIVLLPAAKCVEAVRDCVQRGIPAVLLPSAGFAEAGDEGQHLQRELVEAIAGSHTRLIGPNCNGIVNAANKLLASFVALDPVTPGPISIISQTGIFAAALLNQINRFPGMGIAKVATLGNACDIAAEDVLEYFEDDDQTGVVALYLEGIKDGLRLAHACQRLSRRKPVVALTAGRTEFGRNAVATHTANLASDGKILEGALRQAGVTLATEFIDLVDLARQFAIAPDLRPTRRVMVLSTSGGVGVVAVDHLIEAGLSPARPNPATLDRLRQMGLGAHELRNPLDIWPAMERLGTAAALNGFIEAIGADPDIDSIFFVMGAFSGGGTEFDPTQLKSLGDRYDKTVACWFYGPADYQTPWSQALAKVGIPTFSHIRDAMAALAARERLRRHRAQPLAEVPVSPPKPSPGTNTKAIALNEAEAKKILREYGIATPASVIIPPDGTLPSEAPPFPAAVKILSADLLHKSAVGGVVLDVKDTTALAAAIERIRAAVNRHAPAARHDGFLAEAMTRGRAETILSVMHTREFGPVLMLGLGGTQAETMRRVAFRLPPLSLPQAQEMIAEIGLRDGDLGALAQAMIALAQAAGQPAWRFAMIEINPLLVGSEGEGVVALDAVAVDSRSH